MKTENIDDKDSSNNSDGGFPTFLSRNSSLVDLAIIPPPALDSHNSTVDTFNFVDFPNPEVDPLTCLDDVTGMEQPPK